MRLRKAKNNCFLFAILKFVATALKLYLLFLYALSKFSPHFARFIQFENLSSLGNVLKKIFPILPVFLSGGGDGSHSISSPKHTATTWLPVRVSVKEKKIEKK